MTIGRFLVALLVAFAGYFGVLGANHPLAVGVAYLAAVIVIWAYHP